MMPPAISAISIERIERALIAMMFGVDMDEQTFGLHADFDSSLKRSCSGVKRARSKIIAPCQETMATTVAGHTGCNAQTDYAADDCGRSTRKLDFSSMIEPASNRFPKYLSWASG